VTHKTGLLVATKAPDVPPTGAVSGAKTSKDGTELRHIIDYDSNYLVARSVVSTFSGVTPVYDERVGGHGADRYDLKQYGEGVQPVSVRSLRVNYNGTNADAY
jgi:aspartate/tyrosine/aromatic aminotransferase